MLFPKNNVCPSCNQPLITVVTKVRDNSISTWWQTKVSIWPSVVMLVRMRLNCMQATPLPHPLHLNSQWLKHRSFNLSYNRSGGQPSRAGMAALQMHDTQRCLLTYHFSILRGWPSLTWAKAADEPLFPTSQSGAKRKLWHSISWRIPLVGSSLKAELETRTKGLGSGGLFGRWSLETEMREGRKNWKGRRTAIKLVLSSWFCLWAICGLLGTTRETVWNVSHNCPSNWQRLGCLSTNFSLPFSSQTDITWPKASDEQ